MMMDENSQILIVDDESKNIQVLANTLSQSGYKIEYATNGYDAIELVKSERFDLILLDIMMPEMDGFQTCEQIKGNDVPIVFLTARDDEESIVRGFKSGGIDYIIKPFNQEELLARVNTHIKYQKSKKTIGNLYNNILESIRYAKRIQKSIIPSKGYLNKLIPDNFLLYQQRDIVGGDFYWVREFKDKIFLLVGDCTGHGVPGAMMSILGISILNNILIDLNEIKASTCLTLIYNQLQSFFSREGTSFKDSMELGLLIIDKKSKHIQYSSNNFQMIVASTEPKINAKQLSTYKYYQETFNGLSFEYLKSLTGFSNKIASGNGANIEFNLSDNERIYLFSDGITDQFGGVKNKKLNRKGFLRIIQKYSDLSIDKQGDEIEKEFNNWKKDSEQVDDVILLGFSL